MAIKKLGPYEITSTLGRGGMGTVYAGKHEQTGQEVAVKILASTIADDQQFQDRFKLEIETLKKLTHPNIVKLIGYGEQEGFLFYSMELVKGTNLQDEIKRGRRYNWREVARIGVQVCQALKHAHDNGVVHRDLKPANILHDEADQVVKLTDFGIAKLWGVTQLTAAGGVIGTADYMSPEQAEGKPASAKADIYSLGAVFYALLSGRPPFVAASVAEVMHSLRYDDPLPIREICPDVPQGFEEILMRLLSKNPQNRPATPRVLANQLKAMEYALSMETRVSDSDEFQVKETDPDKTFIDSDRTDVSDTKLTVVPLDRSGKTRLVDPDATIVTHADEVGERASQEPTTSFTHVDGERGRRRSSDDYSDDEEAWWPKILVAVALVAIVIVAGLWAWSMMQPVTSDDLYERIAHVAATAEPSELTSVEETIDEFLKYHSEDPRTEEVRQIQRDLESYRLYRRIEVRARSAGGVDYVSPLAAQAFLVAMRSRQTSPELAQQQFEHLIAVFNSEGADKTTKQCVELARHQLKRLQTIAEIPDNDLGNDLMAQMKQAEKTLKPADLKRWREGAIALFQDKPWASEVVTACKKALADE